MFNSINLELLDKRYFNIIMIEPRDITVQSKNTGHYWYIHNTEYPSKESCVIYHKHKYSHPYHHHGSGNSLSQVISCIKSHDCWQLRGRKR